MSNSVNFDERISEISMCDFLLRGSLDGYAYPTPVPFEPVSATVSLFGTTRISVGSSDRTVAFRGEAVRKIVALVKPSEHDRK
jgi:hypothetical protein